MFNILILLTISAFAGYMLRGNHSLRSVLKHSTPATILLLLFIFGMSIGSNESILSNIHEDGLKAAVIAILGIAGSIAASSCFKYLNRKGGSK